MKRAIYLKMEVDWDDYDDVADELILEDSGVLESIKEGVTLTPIEFKGEETELGHISKVFGLVLNNPANNLTTTARELLESAELMCNLLNPARGNGH